LRFSQLFSGVSDFPKTKEISKLKFSQPRESRLIAGGITFILGTGVLFFTTLIALESFSESPIAISLFLLLSFAMVGTGLYFAACTPVMKIDSNSQTIEIGKSCVLFHTKQIVAFDRVKEIGIKEMYHAGDRTEGSGTTYAVEIRGDETFVVPGTTSRQLDNAAFVANDIAKCIAVRFDPKTRKAFTGSIKLG
jgi:hypothetical protein